MCSNLAAFRLALRKEAKQCFSEKIAIEQGAVGTPVKPTVISLVSVGGLQIQDIPMSGQLQTSDVLQNCPMLIAFLSCFKAPLGRVYLVSQPLLSGSGSVIYQNASHPLFYQTVYLDLQSISSQAIAHVKLEELANYLLNEVPNSLLYLAIEVLRQDQPAIVNSDLNTLASAELFATQHLRNILAGLEDASLNKVATRLDILSVIQIEQGLATVLQCCVEYLPEEKWQALDREASLFLNKWRNLSIRFGRDYQGEWQYKSALNQLQNTVIKMINAFLTQMPAENQKLIKHILDNIAFQLNFFPPAPQRINRKTLNKARQRKPVDTSQMSTIVHFDRPVFIVSAPRSGSTLLFETLLQFNEVWSTGEENHAQLEAITGLHPRDNAWHSNCLNAENASAAVKQAVIKMFMAQLQDKQHRHFLTLPADERPASIRFIEKTPKNALRIPFIKALFPDALFIYLHREQNSNVSSLIDGWRSQRFISYRNLPEYRYQYWSFLLIPYWHQWLNASVAEIATQQWQVSNKTIQNDLAKLADSDWMSLDYQNLIDAPLESISAISQFTGFDWQQDMAARCEEPLPVSRLTLSSPHKEKWRKHKHLLNDTLEQANVQKVVV